MCRYVAWTRGFPKNKNPKRNRPSLFSGKWHASGKWRTQLYLREGRRQAASNAMQSSGRGKNNSLIAYILLWCHMNHEE